MNKVELIGRLTRDPDVRYTAGDNPIAIAKYTLAVDRRYKRDGEPEADFIPCTAFRGAAQFAEKYLHQGSKIAVVGRIQTGSYTDKDGRKVYTTDVIIEDCEFAESKASGGGGNNSGQQYGRGEVPQENAAGNDNWKDAAAGADPFDSI